MQNRNATSPCNPLDTQGVRSRSRRRLAFLRLVSFALPVWMALTAYPAFAAAIGGKAHNANIALPMGGWTILSRINVPASDAEQYCMAVASADVEIPANVNMLTTYLFTIEPDNAAPPMNRGQERTVQFVPGGPAVKEVSTTYAFALPGDGMVHFVYWLGRPAVANPATMVLDRSMTLVCDGKTLGIRNNNPEPLIGD